jgi:hypothetical protein
LRQAESFAQAPITSPDQSGWFTIYTVATGQRAVVPLADDLLADAGGGLHGSSGGYLRHVVHRGRYQDDVGQHVEFVEFHAERGWINLGAPTGLGFYSGAAVSVDLLDPPSVIFYTGETTNNAAYVELVTDNSYYAQITSWQQASLPGIVATCPSTDYFGAQE